MTIVAGDVDAGDNGRVTYGIVEVPDDGSGSELRMEETNSIFY